MNFTLSDVQVALQESVDRFVIDNYDFEQARAKSSGSDGFSRADWRHFAEMGWLMLLIPEDLGGLDCTLVDAALVVEALGRGLASTPYITAAVVAATLLTAADAPADQADLITKIASGESIVAVATEEAGSRYNPRAVATHATSRGDEFALHGAKIIVPDGASADAFLVSAAWDGRVTLFRVAADAPGMTIRRYRTIDRRLTCDLAFAATPATLVMADAADTIEAAIDKAQLMLAAEAMGCMEAALAMTADYLQTREQFGRPLSKFQVLTHRVADMFVRLENARSMLLRGLSMANAPRDERAAAVSATMVTIIQASEFICGQAIQLHGGIGMAEETAVGHYYKRARAIARTYGDLDFHRRRHLSLTQLRAA